MLKENLQADPNRIEHFAGEGLYTAWMNECMNEWQFNVRFDFYCTIRVVASISVLSWAKIVPGNTIHLC